jgi:hypothetical protein
MQIRNSHVDIPGSSNTAAYGDRDQASGNADPAPFSHPLIRASLPRSPPHPFPRALRPSHPSRLSSVFSSSLIAQVTYHPTLTSVYLDIPTMLTQSPSIPPRIHSLYSELPPNSRRAANLPFFAPRALPASSSHFTGPNKSSTPGTPVIPRRNLIPRRNAISYHPSQPASENPLINPIQGQGRGRSVTIREPPQLASPRPSHAIILTEEPKPMSSSPPLVISLAPARVPRSLRDYQAKMVANLLLTRAGRARPMRCARRSSFLRAGYQPSGLSVSVLADDDEETNFEEDNLA